MLHSVIAHRYVGGTSRFGCRQIAFMTEGNGPSAAQQTLLSEVIKDSPNCLKEQSKLRVHPFRDGITTPMHEEDLLRDPQEGCPHGWGFAAYSPTKGNALNLVRSLKPAAEDSQFDATADRLIAEGPQTMLAHVLNKIFPNRVMASEEDTHPFFYRSWSAMFNGVLNGGRKPSILKALNNTYYPALGCAPKGTNTGEKILLYFLGKLQQQHNTLDSQKVELPKLRQAFAETLRDFFKKSQPIYDDTLDGSIANLKGQIQWGPSANYVVTDGTMLMAYRKGRKLYLNQHPAANGQSGYLVSSEPIQPKSQKLTWVELPQDHILTLYKKPNGLIEPTLTPLSSALKPHSKTA